MGDKTKIEWADASWSPVTGCTKISEGCAHCYAERMARRLAGRFGYPQAPGHFDVTIHEDKMDQPRRWKRPRRIFVCSMGDVFHTDVSGGTLDRVWEVMRATPQHTYLVLTKRPHEMRDWIVADWPDQEGEFLPNVWLGISAENQKRADERIPTLLQIPAAGHFVSLEPLLEAVDLEPYLLDCTDCGNQGSTAYVGHTHPGDGQGLCRYVCTKRGEGPSLDWVILGGESGPGARPMHPDWARSVRDQCQEAGVPFLFKQFGAWKAVYGFPEGTVFEFDEGPVLMEHMGKRAAGRLLDGREWNEYPKEV